MTYKEYLNAARKHKNTCEIIKNALLAMNSLPNKDIGRIKRLTINLYYLSGYIIECSVKYGIYTTLRYDKNSDICALNSQGVTYSDHIKHHKFNKYVDKLNMNFGGIKLIDNKAGVSKEVKKLYNGWDAEVRYCYSEIPERFKYCDNLEHVIKFNENAEEIFSYIQNHLR
jgi:hypothetical protein